MTNKEHDQWLVDQYNRNRLVKDHIENAEDIPTEHFEPKGKPHPENDTWFDKNDRKQRG